jgi:DNA repair protein RecO (recombination protein O)
MQLKTEGIILNSVKYSDSATIITVYTRQFGRISYLIYGINKKKSSCRAALLQPLSLVEMNVSHVPGKELHSIKELQICHPYSGIPFNPVKNSVVLFLSEFLFRVLRQTEQDENLYLFLENSLLQFDHLEVGFANFHLVFLIKLSRYLGFEPNFEDDKSMYFDLINGVFQKEKPLHTHYLFSEATQNFRSLLSSDYITMQNLKFSRQERFKLLESIVEYYRLHIPDFQGLHSLSILQSLFD